MKAPTDTIYTINKLFKDVDRQYSLKPVQTKAFTQEEKIEQFRQKMSIVVGHEK